MLINKTRETIIAKKTRICRDVFSKGIGLMFTSRKTVHGKALIFVFSREQRVGLHMIFVFYPIDVIFADGKKRVVETATLKPFCLIYYPKKKAKYVIECEEGSLKRGKVKVGDKIDF